MKKVCLLSVLVGLTACAQAPYTRHVYQATGETVCREFAGSFRCAAPQKVWDEVVYPKNEDVMMVAPNKYVPYAPEIKPTPTYLYGRSYDVRSLYGTWGK